MQNEDLKSHKNYPTDEQIRSALANGVLEQKYADMLLSFRAFARLSDKQHTSYTLSVQRIEKAEKWSNDLKGPSLLERIEKLELRMAAVEQKGGAK